MTISSFSARRAQSQGILPQLLMVKLTKMMLFKGRVLLVLTKNKMMVIVGGHAYQGLGDSSKVEGSAGQRERQCTDSSRRDKDYVVQG